MDYRRFISYLYNYVDGEKGVNVGYIRCEQRHGICRLTLNLQDRQQGVEGGSYKVYLYKISKEGNPVGYYLDEFTLSSGCGELKKQTNCENIWNSNHRIEEFDGVVAIYDRGHAYGSQWSDEPLQIERFHTYQEWQKQGVTSGVYIKESEGLALHAAERLQPVEEDSITEQDIDGVQEEVSDQKEVSNQGEVSDQENVSAQEDVMPGQAAPMSRSDIAEATLRLMEQRPKLPDFDNHEIYDCVRIEPNDIGLLAMDNWRLGVNSFLTHGYYNYKYLMLGKLRFQDGVVKAVLGVPGVYDNKEQYIAKIFGFELFVPVKHTNVKTGNFGYWISEIV